MYTKSIIITGDSCDIMKISRENSRRANIGLITITEVKGDTKYAGVNLDSKVIKPKKEKVIKPKEVVEEPETQIEE